MKTTNRFYIYALLDPRKPGKFFYRGIKLNFEYEPFYIGKGQTNRILAHFSELSKDESRNPLKLNIMKKIKRFGLKTIAIKIEEGLSNSESIDKEIDYIKLIGRRNLRNGQLANLTNGGEGTSGWHHNKKSSSLISESNRKRKISIKTRQKISKSLISLKQEWSRTRRNNQSKRVSGERNFFFGKKFSGPINYMYRRKLSKKRRLLLSQIASKRIGSLNPNSKFTYCIYNHKTNKIIHNTSELSRILGINLTRNPWNILRYKHWTLIRYNKGHDICPCKKLLRIDIKDIPFSKWSPLRGYLNLEFQGFKKISIPNKPWTFLKGVDFTIIKKLYLSGKSSTQISKKIKCSSNAVINILKRNNVQLRRGGQVVKYDYKKIKLFHKRGMQKKDISKILKCSLGVIERALCTKSRIV